MACATKVECISALQDFSIYIGDPQGGERVAGRDRGRVWSLSIQIHAVDIYIYIYIYINVYINI